MIQIRNNVFETNSSMTHSLVICKEDNFKKWRNGEVMFKFDGQKFLDTNKAIKENAKHLRKNLKWYEESGRDYDKNKFNESIIAKYESGNIKAKWLLFSRWDIESYYITYDQFTDYVYNERYELVGETSDVDGIKMTVFGYYGHD